MIMHIIGGNTCHYQLCEKWFPDREITVIFQPHLYTRTRDFADEFALSLSLLDRVILLPVYPARELPHFRSKFRKDPEIIPGKNKMILNLLRSKDSSERRNPRIAHTGAGNIDRLTGTITDYTQRTERHDLLRKIGYILEITVLTAALGPNFILPPLLVRARGESARCQNVIITVKDSVRNPLTGAGEVAVYLDREHISMPGKNFDEIDFTRLEKQLESFASVKKCNAVRTIDGTLRLDLLQHKPIFRMDTPKAVFLSRTNNTFFPWSTPTGCPC
jgi:hypothetical protein